VNIAYAVHAPTCAAKSRWGLCGPFLDADEANEAVKVFKSNRPYTEIVLRYGSVPVIDLEFEEDAVWAKACLARERVLAERRKYEPEPSARFAYHAFLEQLAQPHGLGLADNAYRRFYLRINGLHCANRIGKDEFSDLLDRSINELSERRKTANKFQLELRSSA